MKVGYKLKNLREQVKISQGELAEKLGKKQITISDYERNRSGVSIELLKEIANIFGVELNYFLDEKTIVENFSDTDDYGFVLNIIKTMIEVEPEIHEELKEYDNGEVMVYPYFFSNKDIFNEVTVGYRLLRNDNERWLDNELKAELFLFESYIFNLTNNMGSVSSEDYKKVGVIVVEDIRYFYERIIDLCYKFYNVDIFKLTNKFDSKKLTYSPEFTRNFIENSKMYTNRNVIDSLKIRRV